MASTLKLGKGNWGVKENSLLAYSDQNNNFIPLPFDFSRASSATVVNKAGLIESVTSGLPRIDFSDDTNGALLLEPQSTNSLPYSEDFNEYILSVFSVPIQSGFLAPDGTNTAYKITGTIGSSSMYTPGVTSLTATRSIWARTVSGTGTTALMSYNSNANNKFTINENWQRFELTGANSSGGVNFYPVDFRSAEQTLSEVIIWGGQSEEQSYATSYIPTSGAIATRVQDSCLKTNASEIIGQTEGTFVMDFNYSHNQINVPIFETSTTNSNIYALALSDFKIRFWITLSGSNQVLLTTPTIPSEGRHKLAVAYKQNDSCFYLDGVFVGNDTNCSIPAVSELYLNKFNADVFEFTVFKERLSNAELEALTTI